MCFAGKDRDAARSSDEGKSGRHGNLTARREEQEDSNMQGPGGGSPATQSCVLWPSGHREVPSGLLSTFSQHQGQGE